jgi:hypothetical protein
MNIVKVMPQFYRKLLKLKVKLSTTPWGSMGEWMYISTYSWPRNYLDVSRQLHASTALPPEKEPLVPIG